MPINWSVFDPQNISNIAGAYREGQRLALKDLLDTQESQRRMRMADIQEQQFRQQMSEREEAAVTKRNRQKAITDLLARPDVPQEIKDYIGIGGDVTKFFDPTTLGEGQRLVMPSLKGGGTTLGEGAPKPVKAPETRSFTKGIGDQAQKVTQEWDAASGTWKDVASGSAFSKQVPTIIDTSGGKKRTQIITDDTGVARLVNLDTGEVIKEVGKFGKASASTTKDDRKVKYESEAAKIGAQNALKAAGYDPISGKDSISDLIKKSSGGAIQAGTDQALSLFNVATEGRKANATLKAAANKIVMDMMGGKLGAGISNADREFITNQLGDVGNAMKTTEERLAAWIYAKERMKDIGMIDSHGQEVKTNVVEQIPSETSISVDERLKKYRK